MPPKLTDILLLAMSCKNNPYAKEIPAINKNLVNSNSPGVGLNSAAGGGGKEVSFSFLYNFIYVCRFSYMYTYI